MIDAEEPTDRRFRQPPESVVVGQFSGIKNTVSPERLQPGDLSRALNIDLDNAGQVRRRRGYERVLTGSYHSLRTVGGRTFVVRDGMLSHMRPDLTLVPLVEVGSAPLSYVDVGGITYFSSRTGSGKILPGLVVRPWGQRGGDGTWLSPVTRPTETLGEVGGQLLRAPPLAEWITESDGRIYLAQDTVLWATELYLHDYVDATRTFFQYEDRITGLVACGGGIYVGTASAVYFVSGPLREQRRKTVVEAGCVPGSMIKVTGDMVLTAGEPALQHRDAVMFVTDQGIIVGFDNGFCRNVTANETMLPAAASAATMMRRQDGMHHYVAVLQANGGPRSNAYIGTHVDIEIIRAPRR